MIRPSAARSTKYLPALALVLSSALTACGGDTGAEPRLRAAAELMGRSGYELFDIEKSTVSYDGSTTLSAISRSGDHHLYVSEFRRCKFVFVWRNARESDFGFTVDFNLVNLDNAQERPRPGWPLDSTIMITAAGDAWDNKRYARKNQIILAGMDHAELPLFMRRIGAFRANICKGIG